MLLASAVVVTDDTVYTGFGSKASHRQNVTISPRALQHLFG
jgi:hypothetical protein